MGLKENLESECLRDLPLREPILVSPETTVGEAIRRLRERQLGCAIVVDGQQQPLGFFTERTMIDLMLQQPADFASLLVQDHLDPDYCQASIGDAVSVVMDAILQRGIRFVCVVDEQGRAVSLTGQKGLAEYVAEHFPQQVMVQRVGGKPGLETREGA